MRFVKEGVLYKDLIDNYYDITFLRIDYSTAIIQYINRSNHKLFTFRFYRDLAGNWILSQKTLATSQLKNYDYLWELIKKEKIDQK